MPFRLLLGLAVIILSASASTSAQTTTPSPQAPTGARERQQAFELYDQNRLVEAKALLERLAADHPDDVAVLERYGISLTGYAANVADPAERVALRKQARAVLLQAKKRGDKSDLLRIMLEALPEDGTEPAFSDRKDVDEAMRLAEAAFSRGEMDKAREGYQRALLLDPTLYEAALFAGDTLFKQKRFDAAEHWFRRAIQIDPNNETAYRYWGDGLVETGRMADARAKYIDAIVADPYNSRPRTALTSWAQRNGVQFRVPRIQPQSSVKVEDGKTTVSVDPRSLKKEGPDDGSSAWIMYGITRAAWATGRFKEEFPDEKTYRHSLKEEAHALAVVAAAAAERRKEAMAGGGAGELRADLAELARIHEAGLLEAYILLFRPDEGIAKDYGAYRAANRDKLRRYLDEFVVPAVPGAR